jgi:D-tyrosyl-tRNA(Tyr) deacylase
MRAVIQRVSSASVKVEEKTTADINEGLLILLGIEHEDGEADMDWLIRKILNMRIFDDENGVMNLSVQDINGDIIVVSQFTLHASTKKGNRPSYIKAAKPAIAEQMYLDFVKKLSEVFNGRVQTGIFGAMMKVSLVNDGPVTILIDSKKKE